MFVVLNETGTPESDTYGRNLSLHYALPIVPGPEFDNRPWPCVAHHVNVAEPQMMAAPIHAFDDGIGRARQFVMQATFDQAAKHGIADLFVMDRERCNIRRAYLPTNSCRLAAVV